MATSILASQLRVTSKYGTFESLVADSYSKECPICLEDFTEASEAMMLLPCKHMYCNECFQRGRDIASYFTYL